MNGDDWTVPTDDLLLERWRHCLCCGGTGLTWSNVVPIPGALPLAVVLCARCHRAEDTVERLAERFTATRTTREGASVWLDRA